MPLVVRLARLVAVRSPLYLSCPATHGPSMPQTTSSIHRPSRLSRRSTTPIRPPRASSCMCNVGRLASTWSCCLPIVVGPALFPVGQSSPTGHHRGRLSSASTSSCLVVLPDSAAGSMPPSGFLHLVARRVCISCPIRVGVCRGTLVSMPSSLAHISQPSPRVVPLVPRACCRSCSSSSPWLPDTCACSLHRHPPPPRIGAPSGMLFLLPVALSRLASQLRWRHSPPSS